MRDLRRPKKRTLSGLKFIQIFMAEYVDWFARDHIFVFCKLICEIFMENESL